MTEGGRTVIEMSLLDYIDELLKQNATVEEECSSTRKNYEEIKERYEAERKRFEAVSNHLNTVVINLIELAKTDKQIVSRLGLSQNLLDEIREELKLSLS